MTAFVHISFNHRWTDEELRQAASDFAAHVKPTIPGLIWKIFTNNSETSESCGIYLFDTLEAARAYLEGDRVAGMKQSPDFLNVSARIGEVLEGPSRLAGAPL